ncbi:unnamed protein product [Phytophthora lilii]|uniref:Unnamed protein product n=1 Tax=Phytophthora lilii TaxID=2077276 RepID=A0A9W7DAY9_9STRA|nr:unnamed protein product [Phytophthora lilii]
MSSAQPLPQFSRSWCSCIRGANTFVSVVRVHGTSAITRKTGPDDNDEDPEIGVKVLSCVTALSTPSKQNCGQARTSGIPCGMLFYWINSKLAKFAARSSPQICRQPLWSAKSSHAATAILWNYAELNRTGGPLCRHQQRLTYHYSDTNKQPGATTVPSQPWVQARGTLQRVPDASAPPRSRIQIPGGQNHSAKVVVTYKTFCQQQQAYTAFHTSQLAINHKLETARRAEYRTLASQNNIVLGPHQPRQQSDRDIDHRIHQHIAKGQRDGHYLVVDADLLDVWKNIFISPIGVVDKAGSPADIRVINDYSYPPGAAVNDFTDRSSFPEISQNVLHIIGLDGTHLKMEMNKRGVFLLFTSKNINRLIIVFRLGLVHQEYTSNWLWLVKDRFTEYYSNLEADVRIELAERFTRGCDGVIPSQWTPFLCSPHHHQRQEVSKVHWVIYVSVKTVTCEDSAVDTEILAKWYNRLAPVHKENWNKMLALNKKLMTQPCLRGQYMVRFTDLSSCSDYVHLWRTVNLVEKECTCQCWQDKQFPRVDAVKTALLTAYTLADC